ncbi:hypothetical protein IMG5_181490 [Ichthyophthirius multifiliis]|uniref:GB1/RHD3-type G domain-containing protein n=1 Tax=Ichthyophthirius multifiliis TaxID=5932 RepID=G0R2U8_ICHMU|nr:hypothetical protein IMG5_181490 [Ichthyophthirius multifiliis]EGR28220.1 hypothetical protein IMG5_181490 [Ichthyophthirius multifiliis]|eukprot:XP_004027565.1 hypothetical protein IMG5_181490 [Ichthyophthirius multifiliis]
MKKKKKKKSIIGRQQTILDEKNIQARFSDVIGIDEFKEELLELVDYLKNPKKYHDAGAKLPKGILLVGQPGTGKTLLARALAGEAGCSFFYKNGSEFDEMFVGVGAMRIRELFKKAREKAPSIIFIDEIDSVAGRRNASDPSHSRDTVNQILAEMDGFKQTDNVIVIGATNMEQSIDDAIKRPGRFDKIIHVPLPDIKGQNHVSAKELARQTSGFSGADIQNMVNISILNAIKNHRNFANIKDFDFALDRIAMGIGRKNMFITDKDKYLTAIHEGGHTVAALFTQGATPLHKVTILPRGGALGFTSMILETDRHNYTKKNMIAMIDVAMGGRAAEDLFLGNDQITTGCNNDLAKATEIAYQYVKQLGMDQDFTLLSESNNIQTSNQYNYLIDKEVQKILKESYDRVKGLLQQKEKGLKQLANELIAKETLTYEECNLNPGLTDFIKECGLISCQNNYNIVSIIGAQNSGKSTLLNRVFGTQFEVLQSKSKQQTTKGIWVSRDKEQNVMILDVEGSNSRQRGKGEKGSGFFEKSTALFALAFSQVLILNFNTLNLGHESEFSIIKVIMEMNLRLFKSDQVKQILIVFRDFNDEQDDFDIFCKDIRKEIKEIWKEINKPKELEELEPDALFKINFYKCANFQNKKLKQFFLFLIKIQKIDLKKICKIYVIYLQTNKTNKIYSKTIIIKQTCQQRLQKTYRKVYGRQQKIMKTYIFRIQNYKRLKYDVLKQKINRFNQQLKKWNNYNKIQIMTAQMLSVKELEIQQIQLYNFMKANHNFIILKQEMK